MSIPTLTTLVPVDVRAVWPMESTSFAPWLLANSDTLGEALGMDIHLERAEHKIGGFSPITQSQRSTSRAGRD